ncbi:MAG: hypothetical protein PSV22_12015 [Pseudolabrys sp.]|nr:hypothetical protein [Pseudolabrys sp.]
MSDHDARAAADHFQEPRIRPVVRPISEVAADILRAWSNVHPFEARDALEYLFEFDLVTDFGAREAVQAFLPTARFFAGVRARKLKAELTAILNSTPTRNQFLRRSQMAARRQLQLMRAAREGQEAAP